MAKKEVVKEDPKWHFETHWERGIEEPYEVTEFIKGNSCIGVYEAEEYINYLESVLKEIRDDGHGKYWDKNCGLDSCGCTGYMAEEALKRYKG